MTRSALALRMPSADSGWRARSAAANGARSAADSTPPIVGLMKPSRSEPIATCSGPIASVNVYEGMGSVLRCPECDSVLMRVVVAGGSTSLDMRGVKVLRWRSAG